MRNLSPEKKALIAKEYPKGDLDALAASLGYKVSTVRRYAYLLGIHRDNKIARHALSLGIRETYRKAYLRAKWGLPSKIKRYLPLERYTRAQYMMRFNMKKTGLYPWRPLRTGREDDDILR